MLPDGASRRSRLAPELIDAAGCDLVVAYPASASAIRQAVGPSGAAGQTDATGPGRGGRGHNVTNLRVFGSVARGEDRPDSDVDLLVDLPPDMGLLGLGRVQAELETILGTKVDLVPASDLKPAVRARAERELVAL